MSRARHIGTLAAQFARTADLDHMEVSMSKDPRLNAPPRISDLSLGERHQAMIRRDEAARREYMRSFAPIASRPSLVQRVAGLITGRAA